MTDHYQTMELTIKALQSTSYRMCIKGCIKKKIERGIATQICIFPAQKESWRSEMTFSVKNYQPRRGGGGFNCTNHHELRCGLLHIIVLFERTHVPDIVLHTIKSYDLKIRYLITSNYQHHIKEKINSFHYDDFSFTCTIYLLVEINLY